MANNLFFMVFDLHWDMNNLPCYTGNLPERCITDVIIMQSGVVVFVKTT